MLLSGLGLGPANDPQDPTVFPTNVGPPPLPWLTPSRPSPDPYRIPWTCLLLPRPALSPPGQPPTLPAALQPPGGRSQGPKSFCPGKSFNFGARFAGQELFGSHRAQPEGNLSLGCPNYWKVAGPSGAPRSFETQGPIIVSAYSVKSLFIEGTNNSFNCTQM